MSQAEKARLFASLHVKGKPIQLYNVWDVGSAKAVAQAGASAIATGSWAVASAQGFADGQKIPLELVEGIAGRICEAVNLPVTVDFEGAYAEDPAGVAKNIAGIVRSGAVGINFEDQIVDGEGLYSIDAQCARIAAIRKATDNEALPFFINARTDLFLHTERNVHRTLVSEAKLRCDAYARAGASGFFVPGLIDEALISEICTDAPLPINAMMMQGAPPPHRLAELGISRISYGSVPFASLMSALTKHAIEQFGLLS